MCARSVWLSLVSISRGMNPLQVLASGSLGGVWTREGGHAKDRTTGRR